MLIFAFLCAAGFLAGFIDSVAGGGGLITLPALIAVNLPPHIALGTNKFQSMFGTSFALANFTRKAKVVWRIAAVGIPFALIGSVVGAKLALVIPPSVVAKIIVAAIPPIALFILLSSRIITLPLCKGETEGVDIDLPPPTPPYKGGVEYSISHNSETSIGRINTFFGNFAVLLRAYTYIKELGADGLKGVTEMAVLNANYVCARLKGTYNLPYDKPSLHECVFNDAIQNEFGVKTLDIAKRLMDYGFHPPTIYFPLIVHGSIMIEPTETEPKSVLDDFCDAMISIAKECRENPELVKGAPTHTFRRRIDEVRAAKEMCLRD